MTYNVHACTYLHQIVLHLLAIFCGITSKGNCRHLLHVDSWTWANGVMAFRLFHRYIEC